MFKLDEKIIFMFYNLFILKNVEVLKNLEYLYVMFCKIFTCYIL